MRIDFDEILTQLKNDLENSLPVLLTAKSLIDFDEYEIGAGKNPDKVGLYVYLDDGNEDISRKNLSVIFQLQLTGHETLSASKYLSVVWNYLRKYNPFNIGYLILDNINFDFWPIEENSSTIVYVTCTWDEELDSCDENNEES
jgi:hypothetical protein